MANRTPRDASQAAVAAARAIRTQREEQGRNARQLLYRPTAFPTLQEQVRADAHTKSYVLDSCFNASKSYRINPFPAALAPV